jgi:DNA-binding NtrC family response regulator
MIGADGWTRARVLVVSNEARITDIVGTALAREGFDVDVVATGEEASEALKRTPYEHLLLGAADPGSERMLLQRAYHDVWNLERLEQEYIAMVLARVQGHRGRAARLLGINRRTLHRKLKHQVFKR